jgi:tyrosyl-tRNA synthetase
MKNLTVDEQLKIIKKGTVEIISEQQLILKLKKSIQENKPLKIKLGLDPTSPDIHIGHTVVLQKMRDFQMLGHEVQIIIGDFTGRVGDPTGKNSTRKQLTEEEVQNNSKTYQEQIFKILDKSKTKVFYNSDWFSTMNFSEIIKLASNSTVSQMLERNDFSNRFKENKPICLHEFFYPLMQGYDSVVLASDIEIGGTDQTFNLMMGKSTQKAYQCESQVAITMPILEGLDGVQKMSKSLNNYIGVSDSPNEMFGKIMSIPDSLIIKYFTLLTDKTNDELLQIKKDLIDKNPRDIKMELGKILVTRFHNLSMAIDAEINFIERFQKKIIPENIEIFSINESKIKLIDLLNQLTFTKSKTESKLKIREGAIKIDGIKIIDDNYIVNIYNDVEIIIQFGKRKIIKIILK